MEDHGPAQAPHARSAFEPALMGALAIALAVTAAEIIGGVLSQSLALLADAGHVGTDALALAVGWAAVRVGRRSHTPQLTFGYHRAEVLAAFVNGVSLVVVGALLVMEAVRRAMEPADVQGPLMMAVAVGGLLANLVMLRLVSRTRGENLNAEGVFLHVVGDLLGSVGAIAGAVLIMATGNRLVDPVVGALIGVLIFGSAVRLIRRTLWVLMEGAPEGVDPEKVADTMRGVEGVREVHDLHVWTLTSGLLALSAHVVLAEQGLSEAQSTLRRVEAKLQADHAISHATLQPETFKGRLLAVDESG